MHSRKDETFQDSSRCIQERTQEIRRPHHLRCCWHIQSSWWCDVLVLEKEVLVVRDCYTGMIGAYPCGKSNQAVHRRQESQTGLLWSCSTIHWSYERDEDSDWSFMDWKTSDKFHRWENEPIHLDSHFYMSVGSWITTMFLENSNPLCMSST